MRLSPIRSEGSVELDGEAIAGVPVPPYVRWDRFRAALRLRQGEHITIVGVTGSGKTILARELLGFRSYVVVMGTKRRDPELYAPFEERGYEVTDKFDPEPSEDESRIIFRPRMGTPDEKGRARQRDAFQGMLFEAYEAGGWTIYADELVRITSTLKLATTMEEFWTGGRTEKLTVVGATQFPVYVPLAAFDQATHLFLFNNSDRNRVNRMAEFTGRNIVMARHLIPRLPEHEFLYVNTRTGYAARSKVIV
jgi:hypothetical protein